MPGPDRRARVQTLIGAATGALLALVVLGAVLLGRPSPPAPAALTNPAGLHPAPNLLPAGTVAPSFDLATADGQPYRLTAQRGHVVVLEFFAIWCPHCQHEAPVLDRIATTYRPQGVRMVSVLANPYGKDFETSGGSDRRLANRSDLNWFVQTFHVGWPALIDPTFATVNTYGAGAYPTIYVLDGSGTVRFATSGESSYQQLSDAITVALKDTRPAAGS
jgi:thiol-disulfide isomerase/thioredoxin